MDHKYLSYTGLKRFFYSKILKQINLKVDKTNGDISNTKIRSVDTFETKFPIPAAGETVKRFLGKVITFLRNIKPLESSVSYYVATTGSDITGEGTSVKPFKTIQYTISLIPKNLNGYTATINIDDGTYDESISINGYHSGILVIKSLNSPETLNTLCRVKKATVANCDARIQFHGLYFTQTDDVALSVTSCNMVYVRCCQAIESATSSYAFDFTYATARLSSCKSLNHKSCIRAYVSDIRSESWAESLATEWGISISGGKLSKVGNQPSGVYGAETVQEGGIFVNKYGSSIGTLPSNTTIYVSTAGNDATGSGSSTSPYKTIRYALSTIPADLGGYTATIYLADGTYDETVDIRGFNSGTVDIRSLSSSTALNTVCRVKKVDVYYCSAKINIFGLYMTQVDGTAIDVINSGTMVYIMYCQAVESAPSAYGFNFQYSKVRIEGCRTQNHSTGFRSYFSEVFSMNWATDSSSVQYGMNVDSGGRVAKMGTQPSGNKGAEQVVNGGIIVSKYGTQIGTLQYDVSLYVSNNGSDTTGNGSSSNPYKTVMNAINSLPKDLGGKIATITLNSDYIYNEDVIISNFTNGTFAIRMKDGSENYTVSLGKIRILDCTATIDVSDIEFPYSISNPAMSIINCTSVYLNNILVTYVNTSYDGFQITNSKVFMKSCEVTDRNNGVKINGGSVVDLTNCTLYGNKYGIYSFESCMITVNSNTTITASKASDYSLGNGVKLFNSNGTQISDVISSGLSCTWGTIYGGYVRHGNASGVAMVTVNLSISVTTALTVGTSYSILGFPKPASSGPAVNFNSPTSVVTAYNCFIDNAGNLSLKVGTAIPTSTTVLFTVTYLTNQ